MSNAIFLSPLPIVAAAASSTAGGYDVAYVANDHMGVTWKSGAGSSSQNVVIDLGADSAFDTIALFGLTGAQPGWTLQVQAATAAQGGFGGSFWSSDPVTLLASSAMPSSGRGKAYWTPPPDTPPPSRYIRLVFGSLSSAAVTVARVVIGKRFQPSINFKFGATFGVRDLGSLDFSVRGVLLRRYGAKLRTTGLTFPHEHRDKIEAIVQPLFERIGNTDCIAMVTDPDAHAERQKRMYFGPLIGDLESIFARPGGFEWRANMIGMDI